MIWGCGLVGWALVGGLGSGLSFVVPSLNVYSMFCRGEAGDGP